MLGVRWSSTLKAEAADVRALGHLDGTMTAVTTVTIWTLHSRAVWTQSGITN